MRTNGAERDLSLMDVLTPRQFAVTMLVASGLTNTDIARLMGISAHTVSHHLSDIFERVGCGNRTELTVRYVKLRKPFTELFLAVQTLVLFMKESGPLDCSENLAPA
jgi:DNA-binding CsgD family transcriptional regulator